jgi:hypothetical protein
VSDNALQGSAWLVDLEEVRHLAAGSPEFSSVSKWTASCALALVALGCSDSAAPRWGSSGTSLDVTDRASDAGLRWAGPSSTASVADFQRDAGACAADAGTDCTASSGEPLELNKEYEGRCEGDGVVQWGFLTYEATTPGDSSVEFRIRTAATEQELGRASWTRLITAQASPDTQVCSLFGPEPCPVDLYALLQGSPRAHHPFAELRLIANPTSDGTAMPAVQRWQLNYSCTLSS